MNQIRGRIRPGAVRLGTLALASLIVVACQGRRDTAAGQPAPGALTDANIASIVTTANTAEIQTGHLALERSTNPQVRQFAQRMITDHQWGNEQTMQVLQRVDLTTAPHTTTRQVETNTRETLEALRARSGEDFDRTYIANQVAFHQWLIDSMDQSLIPGSRNDSLERWLTQFRPTLVEHLRLAQQIQTSIGRP